MKKTLLILSLFSILFTSCELTIGDNVNCSCECCKNGKGCSTEQPAASTESNSDFPTDEYNVEEDTTMNY